MKPVVEAWIGAADRGPEESKDAGSPGIAQRLERMGAALGVEVKLTPGEGSSRVGDVDIEADSPDWLLEAALLRALKPEHVLFLCVANSARSQLAEGLGRSLAPAGVRVSSAGSEPTSVRPQAIAALAEIGIDISDHVSTGIDDVERPVSAVITLCAEEVCPVWLGQAWRLHWGLPDPAGVEGSDEEKLDAFRAVRDEVRSRLRVLFEGRA